MSKKECKCDETKVTRNYYRYYDTPDGCDVDKKIMVTTRYGVTTGLILGAYDVMMYSHAVGFGNVIRRFLLHTVPLGLMGATFAAVANGVQHLREKDDELNYFVGGFACGPILAAYLGSKHAILLGGLALGAIGIIKKTGVDDCWTFIPERPAHMGTVQSWRNDYTLVADPRDAMIHTCKPRK
ncbi:unnamed protein product [Diatraea saccharalis]|uniref:NADH dehydrogenase [ubiquinone] 1 alpha subcomplex subunit 11 n=1 Tax=Diatraea saccharalis TaxID=40085 RepID=A0A9N9REU1_9NEOP|nr:unnamed protein product [Diatraea saccharalis]